MGFKNHLTTESPGKYTLCTIQTTLVISYMYVHSQLFTYLADLCWDKYFNELQQCYFKAYMHTYWYDYFRVQCIIASWANHELEWFQANIVLKYPENCIKKSISNAIILF